jgi:short-subunit dehydrogenase
MAGKIGYPFNSAYVAAKHACVGFTHALRAELAETGIHASVVCPAAVRTDWALATEGRAMLPFLSTSGPIIKGIAASRNLPLPPIEGVLTADVIASKIVQCIHHPVAEVYTHMGAQQFVELAAKDREESERYQLAVALGERQAYEQLMKE